MDDDEVRICYPILPWTLAVGKGRVVEVDGQEKWSPYESIL